MRLKASTWRHDQQMRLAILGATTTAKLMRLGSREFRSAILTIQKALKKDPDAPLRQDPAAQKALILEWAEGMGLKVERHARPVI